MNSEAITSNAVVSFTDIEIQAGGATLSGGGAITLSGTQNARLIGLDSVLTVDDQTIEGQGQLGVNSLAMEFGADTMVDANVMDQTLTVEGDVALNVDVLERSTTARCEHPTAASWYLPMTRLTIAME